MAESRRGVRWYQRAGVWVGIATGPGTLTVGGALSAQLPLAALWLVIPLGTLMLTALTVAQAVVSRRRRQPSTARAVDAFGPHRGSALLNLIVALGTLGWFSFYVGLAGTSLASLLHVPGWVGAFLVALGLFLFNIMGLDRWNVLVWLTALLTLGVALFALLSVGTQWTPDTTAALGVGQVLWGAGGVVAYGLLFALRVGDFAWDLDQDEDVFKAGLALFLPLLVFLSIGALTYRAVGDWNIADVLARSQSATLGSIFLVLSVIAPSLSGFHSGSLAMSSISPVGKRAGAVLIAALGFLLGALRFDHQLLLFLDVLGALIAPALVVMLLVAIANQTSGTRALAAWLTGGAASIWSILQRSLSPIAVGAAVSIAMLGILIGWAHVMVRPIEADSEEKS